MPREERVCECVGSVVLTTIVQTTRGYLASARHANFFAIVNDREVACGSASRVTRSHATKSWGAYDGPEACASEAKAIFRKFNFLLFRSKIFTKHYCTSWIDLRPCIGRGRARQERRTAPRRILMPLTTTMACAISILAMKPMCWGII